MNDVARADRRALLWIGSVIGLGVAVRVLTLSATGFASDVAVWMAWAERLAAIGPARFYEPGYFTGGYPPGFPSVLWGLGVLLDGEALRLASKSISIAADVAIAVIVARLLWRRAGRAPAALGSALWSLSPGAILAGPYWGQIDAVGSLAFFSALLAGGGRRWGLAGALAGLALMTKPQFGLTAVVLGAAAIFELIQRGDWRPGLRASLAGLAVVSALALPYGLWVPGLLSLVREGSGVYPYTSLYAFNVWSVLTDFWTPDEPYVLVGAALALVGLVGACVPLWWRRDTAMLLAAAALASAALYLLPTRAHERYIFPAFVMLLPFAATRSRVFAPYLVLAAAFPITLYFALTRYPEQNAVIAPPWLEITLFSRAGQIALALIMCSGFALLAWRLIRGEARLEQTLRFTLPSLRRWTRWELPAALGPGRAPSRRDIVAALLVALAVLATRGYRLDQPRDMYFDEVYHARTAFELLAQRDPYEWTHPHLAKEIMALGILAFGDDRIVGHQDVVAGATALTVSNAGTRVYSDSVGRIFIAERGAPGRLLFSGVSAPIALVVEGDDLYGVSAEELFQIPLSAPEQRAFHSVSHAGDVTAFAVSNGHVVVGSSVDVAIYPSLTDDPVIARVPAAAITAKPDGSELYVLDQRGTIHVVDPATGDDRRSFTGARGTAIAYAQGANRVFVARADEPSLDVIELEGGRRETVPLANDRTGAFAAGATALAVVPRTQFLYALADGRVVVVETHGASPYAAIPTSATRIGVDGTADKLLLAGEGGIDLVETGRHALAWRLPGVLFGAILAFFLVLLARRLFAGRLVAALVGALTLLDGSMFAQPRIGMNDVYVGALLVAAWYFVVAAHQSNTPLARASRSLAGIPSPRRLARVDLAIAGALFGLALASKWVAAYALAALALVAIVATARAYERGTPGRCGPLDLLKDRGLNAAFLLSCFAVVPIAIYLLAYRSPFGGPTAPYGWDLVELTKQMYWYHSGLTSPHPAGSPWWTWPFDLKPVYWYYGQSPDGSTAVIYDAGNLAIFWAALAATAWCAIAAVRARSLSLGFVVFALLAQLVAWIPITRVLFFYHFFTALPYYLLALAAALTMLWARGRRRLVSGYLAAALLVFVFFYPFVSGQPVPADQSGIFFVLPTWQYGCQFYPSFTCDLSGASRVDALGILSRLALPAALGIAIVALWQVPLERIRAVLRGGRPT